MWYTIYKEEDGKLIGHTEREVSPRTGVVITSHPERMDQKNIWNDQSLSWEARPVSREARPAMIFEALTAIEFKKLCESSHADVTAFFRALDILEKQERKINKGGLLANLLLDWLVNASVLTSERKQEILS